MRQGYLVVFLTLPVQTGTYLQLNLCNKKSSPEAILTILIEAWFMLPAVALPQPLHTSKEVGSAPNRGNQTCCQLGCHPTKKNTQYVCLKGCSISVCARERVCVCVCTLLLCVLGRLTGIKAVGQFQPVAEVS